jgi:hypothetical protein
MKEFMGWEWVELGKRWKVKEPTPGLTFPCNQEVDDTYCLNVKDYMLAAIGNKKKEPKVAKDIREFLTVLHKKAKKNDYNHPVWAGLLKVEHDETLIRFTVDLLSRMWT